MTLSYNHVYSCNQWVVDISEAKYVLIFMTVYFSNYFSILIFKMIVLMHIN